MSEAFGYWLSGFVDGEGCFYVDSRYENGRRPSCQFIVNVRLDDLAIIEEARRFTGDLGTLKIRRKPEPKRPGSRPSVYWRVYDIDGLLKLVDVFERYPLRAKKASDFKIWKQAVALQAQYPDHRSCRGRNAVEPTRKSAALAAQIQDLGAELKTNREYREPECPPEYERMSR